MKVPYVESRLELDQNELGTLKYVAMRDGIVQELKVTTEGIKEDLKVSSQTVSRRLRRLEEMDLLSRKRVTDGQLITVTGQGVEVLKLEHDIYKDIFGTDIELQGTVRTGLGEGTTFVGLQGYATQFNEKLGYEPYPGTFNLRLNESSQMRRKLLHAVDPMVIDGWEDGDRSFGAVHCYPAHVDTGPSRHNQAHIVTPVRTSHDKDELEIVAPVSLRDMLAVEDGDEVTVHVD